jgi:hypothetical protein
MSEKDERNQYDGIDFPLEDGQTLEEVILDRSKSLEVRTCAIGWLSRTHFGTEADRKSVIDFIEKFGLIDDPCDEVAGVALHYAAVLAEDDDRFITPEKLIAFLEDSRPYVQVEAALTLHGRDYPGLADLLRGWLDIYSEEDSRHFFALQIVSEQSSRGETQGDVEHTGGG